MPEALQTHNNTVELRHLPKKFIENLDILYGQLLLVNGGFATWTMDIKNGKFAHFSNEQKFLPEKMDLTSL